MSASVPTPAAPTRYHHGDLRRALLDSAGVILSETGRWDFSLREVARHAGVSHAASYRHFADKEALIAAIAVTGYEALHAQTTMAADGISDAAERLKAIGHAYIRFGIANPALYRLMFGQALPSVGGLAPTIMKAANAARAGLRKVILEGARTKVFTINPEDANEVTVASVAAWSLVHGFTFLTIDQVIEREIGDDVIEDLAARVAERFIAGLTPKR